MILKSVKVDGFGIHHDLRLDLAPGLNVVHGDNEAGKSTLLGFVRAIFWGFERRDGMELTQPVRGGRHGGSVVLETGEGRVVRISRHFQKSGRLAGELSAEDPASGAAVDAERAMQEALGNCTRLLFENVFAIALDDLARNGQLSGEGLRNHIYGAGSTGRGVPLPVLLADLRKRARELLPPTGRGGRVTRLLDVIAAHRLEIQSLSERPDEHRRAVERLAEIARKLAAVDEALPMARAAARRAERLSRAAEPWIALSALPAHGERPRFPAAGVERLKASQEALERSRVACDRAVRRRDELARKLKRAVVDARLLEHAAEIDALWAESDRRIAIDAPALAAARASAARTRLATLKEALGAGWTAGRLASFDATQASERDLLRLADRTAEAERALREARRDADAAGEAEARHREAIARLQAEIERIGDAEERAAQLEKRVSEFERTLEEERTATILRSDVERRASGAGTQPEAEAILAGTRKANRPLWVIAGVMALVGAALLIARQPLPGLALLALSLAPVFFAVWRLPVALPTVGPTGRELEESRHRLERARTQRKDRSILCFDRPDGTAEDAHGARAEVGRLRALAQRKAEAERLVAEAKGDLATAVRVATEKRRLGDEAQETWETARDGLRAWLSAHDFPATLAVETARSTLLQVREVHDAERAVAEADDESARVEAARKEFEERVARLATAIDRGALGEAHVFLTGLRDESLRARKLKDEREQDRVDLEEAEVEAKEAALEVESAEKSIAALLLEAEAPDVDAFYVRAKEAHVWERTEEQRSALEARLRAALGEDADDADVRGRLGRVSPDELSREAAERGVEVARLEAERDALLDERARVDAERAAMESEDRLAAARLAESSRRAELADTAEQWRVLSACEWLVERARKKFEEEHQPVVLRAAGRILEGFTRGRWSAVRASGEDPENPLRVTRFDGEHFRVDQLSRGTLDQLYLALRLALAAEFPDPGVRIPVVLDDVLVNFSSSRRDAAAEAIAAVAQGRGPANRSVQVLAFTCHPELRDALLAAEPAANRVELPDPARPAEKAARATG